MESGVLREKCRSAHLGGVDNRGGDSGDVGFGVVQGLALEEGVVVVVSPNLPHEEERLAEILLAICFDLKKTQGRILQISESL